MTNDISALILVLVIPTMHVAAPISVNDLGTSLFLEPYDKGKWFTIA